MAFEKYIPWDMQVAQLGDRIEVIIQELEELLAHQELEATLQPTDTLS